MKLPVFRLSTTAHCHKLIKQPTIILKSQTGFEEKASCLVSVKYEFEYIYCSKVSYIHLRACTIGSFYFVADVHHFFYFNLPLLQ